MRRGTRSAGAGAGAAAAELSFDPLEGGLAAEFALVGPQQRCERIAVLHVEGDVPDHALRIGRDDIDRPEVGPFLREQRRNACKPGGDQRLGAGRIGRLGIAAQLGRVA